MHHELRLDLVHRIKSDADYDQQTCSSEERGKTLADSEPHHEGRQYRNDREKDRARKRNLRQDVVDEVGSVLPGPDTRDEPALFLHVIRDIRSG